MRVRNISGRDRDVGLALTVRGPGFSTRVTPRMRGGGRARRRPRPERQLSDTAAAAVAARPPRALLAGGRRRRGRQAALHLPDGVRREEAPARAQRRAAPERPQAQPARRQHPRGRAGRRLGARPAPARRHAAAAARPRRHRHARPLPAAPRASWSRSTAPGSCTGARRRSTSCPNAFLNRRHIRAAAIEANRRTVLNNANHASIFVWSIGNELGGDEDERGGIGPGCAAFIRDARRAVRQLDDTRLVGIDRQSRIGEPIFNRELAALDVLGRQRVLRLVPHRRQDRPPADHHRGAGRVPRPGARGLPAHAAGDHRVRRRGQPPGPGRRRRAPTSSRPTTPPAPRDPRLQALHQRVDRLGAEGLPRRPRVARRRARRVRHAAMAQQEPDRGERRPQARLPVVRRMFRRTRPLR